MNTDPIAFGSVELGCSLTALGEPTKNHSMDTK